MARARALTAKMAESFMVDKCRSISVCRGLISRGKHSLYGTQKRLEASAAGTCSIRSLSLHYREYSSCGEYSSPLRFPAVISGLVHERQLQKSSARMNAGLLPPGRYDSRHSQPKRVKLATLTLTLLYNGMLKWSLMLAPRFNTWG